MLPPPPQDFDDEEPPSLVPVDPDTVEELPEELPAEKVPITIVTGYLGAGKTTLMNYILNEQHQKRIAVILNEFGDSADIEKSLTVQQDGQQVEEWLELNNGCMCCTIKDTGVTAIEKLMEKRGKFDYILLETTGLADPGNIAPLFWLDDGIGSSIFLDGIVTLVDAANIIRSLDDKTPIQSSDPEERAHPEEGLTTAHLQISQADVIVINKADLVSKEQLDTVKERVQAINGLARIIVAEHGKVEDLGTWLLDLKAYQTFEGLKTEQRSKLDPTISTVAVKLPALTQAQLDKVDEWLRSVCWDMQVPAKPDAPEYGEIDVHRVKGRMVVDNKKTAIIQGVREIFEISDHDIKEADGAGDGKLVLIGRNLRLEELQRNVDWFVLGE
ncbi:CobW/HypB/UreG [Ascodesmis nigricans]|uniref:CobW/HypB/UreG n=1 Tax=Ascodesmis nigricans TaxID=341454 RepID=A0A4S2N0I1_9PEZI|nr:CobW/HypB/UreG [Ascodesmis nigricans]